MTPLLYLFGALAWGAVSVSGAFLWGAVIKRRDRMEAPRLSVGGAR